MGPVSSGRSFSPRAVSPPPGGWHRLLRELPWLLRAAGRGRPQKPPPHPPWWHWRAVVKLDPDRGLPDSALDQVLEAAPDALVVGGTQGITAEKVLALLSRLERSRTRIPVWLEVSAGEAAIPGVGGYLIPHVLNAGDPRWCGRAQAAALASLIPRFGWIVPWDRLWPAAYLVLNPDSAVARLTGSAPPPPDEAVGYAALAGRLLRLPLLYVEYSGRLGDLALVDRLRRAAGPSCRVWYGGGIDGPAPAAAAARRAHTVVVGNAAHTSPGRLAGIVEAVRGAPAPP